VIIVVKTNVKSAIITIIKEINDESLNLIDRVL